MFNAVLRRFLDEAPVCVAVRATLERLLAPAWLDELFGRVACHQYESKLLFSTLSDLMSQVVCSTRRSIHEAYQHAREIGVSITSVYNKLNGLEPPLSAALVRQSGKEAAAVMRHLTLRPALLKGYEVRIVDGNHLTTTQHRLKELRTTRSGPLPGQSLVVFDPRRRLMVEMVPCEDAHAQERALIGALFELVKGGELWMADRNFCTTLMLRGLINRGAFFLIRQHASTLYLEKGGPWRKCGACKSGTVYEQSVPVRLDLCSGREQWVTLRRIKLKLKKPTEDGDWEIHLLSNLPQSARAEKLAQLYADRWQIEDAFGELTASLRCEINTLGYPRAALFAFALALLAYNAVSLIKTALIQAHGGEEQVEEKISFYQLSREVAATSRGMEVAVDGRQWKLFTAMTAQQFARWLIDLAGKTNLRRYRKHPRGPQKPYPPRTRGRRIKHVATARILRDRLANSG